MELRCAAGLSDPTLWQAVFEIERSCDSTSPEPPTCSLHSTFPQVPSPGAHTADLSWPGLVSLHGRDAICRLGEGCQGRGGVKQSSHPEGSPAPRGGGTPPVREKGAGRRGLFACACAHRAGGGTWLLCAPSRSAVEAALVSRGVSFSQNHSCGRK